ncbi:MAG: cupin domain-containing protein [Bacteroidetes bacterium]|nr:cupin domain-containing protein [Bacteroidota bacterium]
MINSSTYWIQKLHLQAHPEGGHFNENYRSAKMHGDRNIATSIYFLLKGGEVSHLHRLTSDELWYYHFGQALKVTVIDLEGKLHEYFVGPDLDAGQQLQLIIPAGSIFGSEVVGDKNNFSLVGCMVSPGFDFRDFELFTTSQLLKMYPQYPQQINRLTKEKYLY